MTALWRAFPPRGQLSSDRAPVLGAEALVTGDAVKSENGTFAVGRALAAERSGRTRPLPHGSTLILRDAREGRDRSGTRDYSELPDVAEWKVEVLTFCDPFQEVEEQLGRVGAPGGIDPGECYPGAASRLDGHSPRRVDTF
ncbi:hypothetical protein GCM10009800_47990 [Nocardiopsis rhodophaea]